MEILVLSILILMNGFFALSEIALVSSKKSRLEEKKKEGSKGAKIALELRTNSENFLSAIQVGITFIGIVTGMYGGINIADDVAPLLQNIEFIQNYASQIALTLTVFVITYFSIVIGELVPKTIALNSPEKIAVIVAPMIHYFSRAFYPFVKLLSFSTNIVNNVIGIKKTPEFITEAELRQMLKAASIEGVIDKEQNTIHEKVFYFADKKAKHIMTHRIDVEWVDISKTKQEIIDNLITVQHSKLVCGDGSLDNFKGILNLKDFYKHIAGTESFDINALIDEPLIVSENIIAQKVLELFRQKRIHLCCVVNEYGGFEGLITLHDIVENIVGQMPDESEIVEPNVFRREDNSVLVNGDAPIETISEIIEGYVVDFDNIDYSTVAGFVFSKLGKIPQIGDKFEFMDYRIEIVDLDGRKIDKLLIAKIE